VRDGDVPHRAANEVERRRDDDPYRLRLSPGERIRLLERTYADIRQFALAAAQSRGELD
jgi:hypothetical protein